MSKALAAARPGAHGFNNAPSGNGIQPGVILWIYYSRIIQILSAFNCRSYGTEFSLGA
jgi:hypothetical protein